MIRNNGLPGLYFAFEGVIGSGKTEQIRLVKERFALEYAGIPVTYTREPGGTPYAEQFRKLIKENELGPLTEAFAFREARGDKEGLLPVVVRPALERGEVVFSDRTFLSSMAIQGGAKKLGIEWVYQLNKPVLIVPDVVVYLNRDIDRSLSDSQSGADSDKFDREPKDFHEAVKIGYSDALVRLVRDHRHIKFIDYRVDHDMTIPEVHAAIWPGISDAIDEWIITREGQVYSEFSGGVHGVERG